MGAGDSARLEAERVRAKIETLQKYLAAHERGAEGEQRTAEALDELGPEWVTFHDLRWPGRKLANVDHVVVGPAGIFVIDSKNWSGAVTVRDGVLRQNGYNRERATAGASDAALAVAQLAGPYAAHVHPVLCFVGSPDMRAMACEVLVCSDDTVVELLQTRTRLLTPQHVLDAATRLDIELSSATAPRASTQPPAPPRPKARSLGPAAPAGRKSGRSGARRLLVAVVAVLAFLTLGLPMLSAAAPAFGEWFVHLATPDEKCPAASEADKNLSKKEQRQAARKAKEATSGACQP